MKALRYSGIGALEVLAITLVWAMARAGFSPIDKRPLSDLVLTPEAKIFTVGLVITGIFMLAFWYYLDHQYGLSLRYKAIFTAAMVGLLLIVVVPDQVNGQWQLWHWVGAWAFALAMVVSLGIFGVDHRQTKAGRVATTAFWVLAVAIVPEIVLAHFRIMAAGSQLFNIIVLGIWVIVASRESTIHEHIAHT